MNLLSDLTVHTKYARHLQEESRRENYSEIIERVFDMHKKKYPNLTGQIEYAKENYVLPKKVLPSMRSLQFGGTAIERNPSRINNCAYLPVEHLKAFSEAMFLLLGGTGLGYSVQYRHVYKLPSVAGTKATSRRYLIDDSIEGWADAIRILMEAHFYNKRKVNFDFSQIREKGMPLITAGGKAPGPQPLINCLFQLDQVLRNAAGRKLSPLECHEMMCFIADAVLSGGIRRAALGCLFSLDDTEMLTCKTGTWWETKPWLGRANNSAVLIRNQTTQEQFNSIFDILEFGQTGDPGFFWTNNPDIGTNPCFEVSLKPYQFCNLVTLDASKIEDQEDLDMTARTASFIATLQAGYTDFHYLREEWKTNTEEDALIGVSITGIASGRVENLDLKGAANAVKEANAHTANAIGINPASRTTTNKPDGTSSLFLSTSSGIHGYYDKHYLRRIQYMNNEPFMEYLRLVMPEELIEPHWEKPTEASVVTVPMKAPSNAALASEPALTLLERVKKYNVEWIQNGHRVGDNFNNVSCTVNVSDDEWSDVRDWMWINRDCYTGIAIFPRDGGKYKQAPFESITAAEYERLNALMPKRFNFDNVIEVEDGTALTDQVACAGNSCEI